MNGSRTYHGRLVPLPDGVGFNKDGREVLLTVALPLRDAGPILDLITAAPDGARLPVALAIGEAAAALEACLRPEDGEEVRCG